MHMSMEGHPLPQQGGYAGEAIPMTQMARTRSPGPQVGLGYDIGRASPQPTVVGCFIITSYFIIFNNIIDSGSAITGATGCSRLWRSNARRPFEKPRTCNGFRWFTWETTFPGSSFSVRWTVVQGESRAVECSFSSFILSRGEESIVSAVQHRVKLEVNFGMYEFLERADTLCANTLYTIEVFVILTHWRTRLFSNLLCFPICSPKSLDPCTFCLIASHTNLQYLLKSYL